MVPAVAGTRRTGANPEDVRRPLVAVEFRETGRDTVDIAELELQMGCHSGDCVVRQITEGSLGLVQRWEELVSIAREEA
jgi:hypothetical protein